MDFLLDAINNWLKELLISGITNNLTGLFDSLNQEVSGIATQVGQTPQAWNGSIFNMIRTLSETVIVPIAGILLTFVMCMELIQLIIDKNNKWIFKTFCAVLIVTNTWNIVMAVFDVAQHVVNQSAGIITADTAIDLDTVIPDLAGQLEAMDVGPLLGLWLQSIIVSISLRVLALLIMLITFGRMIEIYLVSSIAPIPMAAMMGREFGGMGQNYLRTLLALGFQAFLIIICVAIYAVLVQGIAAQADVSAAMWSCMGYTVLLCFTLFKTGSLSSIAYVPVPKDLTKVKSKIAFNLTKRQLLCFGAAALVGVPLYFLLRVPLGTTAAAMVMMLLMLPFFLLAMYERNGQPLEKVVGSILKVMVLRPHVRPYRTDNAYAALVRQAELWEEVERIAQDL